jgi:hypothetical protein
MQNEDQFGSSIAKPLEDTKTIKKSKTKKFKKILRIN